MSGDYQHHEFFQRHEFFNVTGYQCQRVINVRGLSMSQFVWWGNTMGSFFFLFKNKIYQETWGISVSTIIPTLSVLYLVVLF